MFSEPGTPRSCRSSTRLAAALRVKVTARMRLASWPPSRSRAARRFIAKDLPVPGPAITRRGVLFVAAISLAVPTNPSSQAIFSSYSKRASLPQQDIGEEDAMDLFSLVSYLHRRRQAPQREIILKRSPPQA